jgi:hypothetical protein
MKVYRRRATKINENARKIDGFREFSLSRRGLV